MEHLNICTFTFSISFLKATKTKLRKEKKTICNVKLTHSQQKNWTGACVYVFV